MERWCGGGDDDEGCLRDVGMVLVVAVVKFTWELRKWLLNDADYFCFYLLILSLSMWLGSNVVRCGV